MWTFIAPNLHQMTDSKAQLNETNEDRLQNNGKNKASRNGEIIAA